MHKGILCQNQANEGNKKNVCKERDRERKKALYKQYSRSGNESYFGSKSETEVKKQWQLYSDGGFGRRSLVY